MLFYHQLLHCSNDAFFKNQVVESGGPQVLTGLEQRYVTFFKKNFYLEITSDFSSKSWNSTQNSHRSPLCFRLLETVLGYIHAVARSMEKNADKLTGKFWRALLSKAYDLLDKVGFVFYYCSVSLQSYLTKLYLKNKLSCHFSEQNAAQIFLGKESLDHQRWFYLKNSCLPTNPENMCLDKYGTLNIQSCTAM